MSADNAGDLATHDDLSTRDHARDLSFLTDDHLGRLHVTLDLAVVSLTSARGLRASPSPVTIAALERSSPGRVREHPGRAYSCWQ